VIAAAIGRSRYALKRKVVRFGGAGREDDLLRAGADKSGDLRARLLDRRRSPPPREMLRMRIADGICFQERQQGIAHAWVGGRGGLVVEINRIGHSHLLG
jgi:hypothetical protein